MRGIFKCRPSFPKYEEIWDPYPVLVMLGKLYPLHDLDLKILSIKLILLLALCTAQRVQTLSSIRLENTHHREEGLHIKINDILKTSTPKSAQPKL